jgi:hypothetical protein
MLEKRGEPDAIVGYVGLLPDNDNIILSPLGV